MNKTLRYALGAVLTAGFVLPVVAQDNFPDVPDNHWAYEALSKMKAEGLLVGYPDGLFRGGRPATRYELAVALYATYSHLKGITDNLQSQIDAIKGGGPTSSGPSQADFDALKQQVASLQSDINNMKGWGDDIANLKKMASTFEKELSSLGVDVESMKKDLADLAARVGALEKNKLPITVHGTLDMLMIAGASTSNRPGVTVDGRPVGVNPVGGGFQPVGLTQDLSIFHEAGLTIAGTNESGPKWHATLVVGNTLGGGVGPFGGGLTGAFPNQSQTASGMGFSEGPTDIYFHDFVVNFDTSLVGQNFTAELGRTGYKISPYLFQRPDVTPYYANDMWDDGRWMFDGGVLGFHFGSASFNVFAGRNTNRLTSSGVELQPMAVGQIAPMFNPGSPLNGGRPVGLIGSSQITLTADQSLGLHLNVPLTENGKLDLAYLFFEANDTQPNFIVGPNTWVSGGGTIANPANGARAANRAQVFGGDLSWNFGALKFEGGYSQSNLYNGKHTVVSRDNAAWHAQVAYDADRWGAQVGYREIQPLFGAPGDWGRIGMWWNPTDIRGVNASAHINLTDQLKLSAGGEWYNGTGKTLNISPSFGGGVAAGLNTDDRITRWTIDLGYKLNDSWSANLGFEAVDWDLKARNGAAPGTFAFAGGKPRERWYNIGLGYNLSDMARLSFLWQISDYNANGTAGFAPFGFGAGRATGNLITTQLSVKF
jgi:hypothetical protein